MTGQLGAQAAAQWVLDRPESTTQWSIVKQGSSGSVLCSRASPAVYSQPALEVTQLHHWLLAHVHNPLNASRQLTDNSLITVIQHTKAVCWRDQMARHCMSQYYYPCRFVVLPVTATKPSLHAGVAQ